MYIRAYTVAHTYVHAQLHSLCAMVSVDTIFMRLLSIQVYACIWFHVTNTNIYILYTNDNQLHQNIAYYIGDDSAKQ